jgi:hypothetical protein
MRYVNSVAAAGKIHLPAAAVFYDTEAANARYPHIGGSMTPSGVARWNDGRCFDHQDYGLVRRTRAMHDALWDDESFVLLKVD